MVDAVAWEVAYWGREVRQEEGRGEGERKASYPIVWPLKSTTGSVSYWLFLVLISYVFG